MAALCLMNASWQEHTAAIVAHASRAGDLVGCSGYNQWHANAMIASLVKGASAASIADRNCHAQARDNERRPPYFSELNGLLGCGRERFRVRFVRHTAARWSVMRSMGESNRGSSSSLGSNACMAWHSIATRRPSAVVCYAVKACDRRRHVTGGWCGT